jgi:hypothetical protein
MSAIEITFDDLKLDYPAEKTDALLESWHWLVNDDFEVLLITAMGDLFLTDEEGIVYWLNTADGELSDVADNTDEFDELLKNDEQVEEWFLVPLIAELKQAKNFLKEGNIYSFIELPILGGEYEIENITQATVEGHFSKLGDLHYKLQGLQDGASVEI